MQSPLLSPRHSFALPSFVKSTSQTQYKEYLKTNIKIASLKEKYQLILSDKYIIIKGQLNNLYQISLGFQIKFQLDNNCLLLSYKDEQIQILMGSNQLQIWKIQLKKRLCQKFKNLPLRIKKRVSIRNHCAIYLAQQNAEQKGIIENLAVKAFRKSTLGEGKNYQQFKNQLIIMKHIKHNNLCSLKSVYQSDNSYYICMPYYEGGTLLDKHMNEKLSYIVVKDIMRQVLIALNYLHQRGIIHRDIKPENILMQKIGSNQIAIIDFGLAAFVDHKQKLSVRCGTPGYVAPQIFKSNQNNLYNEKCDIFSAGILFYWLLTRKLPYSARNQDELKRQNYQFSLSEKILKEVQSFPIDAIQLLQFMLQRDPKIRISANQALNTSFFNSKQKCFNGLEKQQPFFKIQNLHF